MNDKEWAQSIADRIAEKTAAVAHRNREKIPYTTVNGVFDDWSENIWWWTNGFWAGEMWLLYHAYQKEEFKEIAESIEEKLDAVLMDYQPMDHDAGFRYLILAVANYRMTGNKASRNRGLIAANALVGRFNLAGNFIRAWNDSGDGNTAGWAIIDCMMNLPLLYWASKELNDPRFRQVAVAHADTAQWAFIRENGSVNHIVVFDPESGELVSSLGGQGLGEGSSWTRGQSWALYGFTLSYLHTHKESYLETAKKVAEYFISQIPDSGIVPVDFCQDSSVLWEDGTAAAIAACGLLELEKLTEGEEKARYHQAAMKLLHTLAEERCSWDMNVDHLLEKCTAAYHDEKHDFAIIYGDYFFTEAILKLAEKDIMLW